MIINVFTFGKWLYFFSPLIYNLNLIHLFEFALIIFFLHWVFPQVLWWLTLLCLHSYSLWQIGHISVTFFEYLFLLYCPKQEVEQHKYFFALLGLTFSIFPHSAHTTSILWIAEKSLAHFIEQNCWFLLELWKLLLQNLHIYKYTIFIKIKNYSMVPGLLRQKILSFAASPLRDLIWISYPSGIAI